MAESLGVSASASSAGDFSIRLKGWRSQLRWAMTQREEDPARVWLEVISIDERSKRALADATDPDQVSELQSFRAKLETSIASITEQLGDENVAPLYSWLDLVRQQLRSVARVELARASVAQTRAVRGSESQPMPTTDEEAAEQLARAQADLEQWKRATPPEPPPEVRASWLEQGGDLLVAEMDRDALAVAKRGDAARALLTRRKGHTPGESAWVRSRGELIAVPVAAGVAVLAALFAIVLDSGALATLAYLGAASLSGLVAFGVFARRRQKLERVAAVDWTWHRMLYVARAKLADLEAAWLRELVDSQRGRRSFEATGGSGGQLSDFEAWRPDLAEMVHEVARDTGDPRSGAANGPEKPK